MSDLKPTEDKISIKSKVQTKMASVIVFILKIYYRITGKNRVD